jgi:hypothetical protein
MEGGHERQRPRPDAIVFFLFLGVVGASLGGVAIAGHGAGGCVDRASPPEMSVPFLEPDDSGWVIDG